MIAVSVTQPVRKMLLALHIVTAVGVLGADLVLLVLGTWAAQGASPMLIYPIAYLIAGRLIAPLALLALSTGALLAILTQPKPWSMWVTTKFAITAVLTAVVFLVLLPRLGAMANPVSSAQLQPRQAYAALVVAPVVANTFLFANVLLAVFKPTWRPRSKNRNAGELAPRYR